MFGDELSLGFVTETEAQVEGHLASHLERLPAGDARSRQILEQMKIDEAGHGQAALSRGASRVAAPDAPAHALGGPPHDRHGLLDLSLSFPAGPVMRHTLLPLCLLQLTGFM